MTKNRAEKHSARARMATNSEPYSVAARAVAPLSSWSSLDDALNGGFKPGQVYLVTAPSGTHKSRLATNLIAKFALGKHRVLSMASSLNSFVFNTAVLEAASGENSSNWRLETEKSDFFKTIFIELKPYMSHFAQAYSAAEIDAYLTEEKHDVLVINSFEDSIGVWRRVSARNDTDARALKDVAMKHNIPVIIFATTHYETSELVNPVLAEVADASIELSARDRDKELIVTKNRSNRTSDPVVLRAKAGASLALIEA